MTRYICIHGHFYQPPRENPWLEAIEVQDSAYPFHDWNERISAECYSPNAASRILDDEGMITKIVNNYASISFNFGPTLLSWLQSQEPEVYQAIVQADRLSIERFGRGSAMAQVYNHVIMPLASRRDRETQVRWGIADFERRFGRRPEGMWLAETAVDTETLSVLAEHGIEFTVLAPRQAKATRELGVSSWIDHSEQGVNPRRPYRIPLPGGREITVFFYDGGLSQAVAFENLLINGQVFADRLRSAFGGEDGPQLVHIATDGETYGHHHRYGDMALAYALERIDEDEEVELTNYAAFLQHHPPRHEAKIVEDSSWSCAHGVERWRSDCGCSTGGPPEWDQRWRDPLRAALDELRDQLGEVFEEEGRALLEDPWAARDDYIQIILERSPHRLTELLSRHAHRDLMGHEQATVLKLLEMQRHEQLMYTSCGWFFSDLSGIETVQILHYAGRAIQLASQVSGRQLEAPFLEGLAQARSNLSGQGTGRQIYQRYVVPAVIDLSKLAAHYAASSLFDDYPDHAEVYAYSVDAKHRRVFVSGRRKLTVGHVLVTSTATRETADLTFGVLHFGDHNLTGGVRPFSSESEYRDMLRAADEAFARADLTAVLAILTEAFGPLSYSMQALFRDQQRRVLDQVLQTSVSEAVEMAGRLYERHAPLLRYLASVDFPIPTPVRNAAQLVLDANLRRACEETPLHPQRIRSLLLEAEAAGVSLDTEGVAYALKRSLEKASAQWSKDLLSGSPPVERAPLRRMEEVIRIIGRLPVEVELSKLQNRFHLLLTEVLPKQRALADERDPEARAWCDVITGLADALRMRLPA